MRKEKKQWAPGAAVLSEKWQNGCATRSGGHQDPHSRAAQTGGQDQTVSQAQGREATQTRSLLSRGSLSTATCVSTALGSPSNHMADTPRTGWGRDLSLTWQVAAPGRSTSPSTVCTWHSVQVKQRARCKQLVRDTMGLPNSRQKYHTD